MTDAAPIVTCEVLYSCTRCRTTDAPVTVRIREPDEDLVAWMRNVVVPAIAIAHRARSPWCWAPTISQIKISTIGTPYVGGPVHQ